MNLDKMTDEMYADAVEAAQALLVDAVADRNRGVPERVTVDTMYRATKLASAMMGGAFNEGIFQVLPVLVQMVVQEVAQRKEGFSYSEEEFQHAVAHAEKEIADCCPKVCNALAVEEAQPWEVVWGLVNRYMDTAHLADPENPARMLGQITSVVAATAQVRLAVLSRDLPALLDSYAAAARVAPDNETFIRKQIMALVMPGGN